MHAGMTETHAVVALVLLAGFRLQREWFWRMYWSRRRD